MELKSLLVDSKTTWVEFPGLEDFEVELANLSRKELVALRKRCTTNKFNRKTRAFEESLDDDKFLIEFTNATVKSWKNLKLGYLEDLVLVNLDGLRQDKIEFCDHLNSLKEKSIYFPNMITVSPYTLSAHHSIITGLPGNNFLFPLTFHSESGLGTDAFSRLLVAHPVSIKYPSFVSFGFR